jgi:hypothetical protein
VASYANPQSLDRYSYVLNNPLLYADPTGHWAVESNNVFAEQRRDAYVGAWKRTSKDRHGGQLKEYYLVAAGYYQTLVDEAPAECTELLSLKLKGAADNVIRNNWNGDDSSWKASGDVILGGTPDLVGNVTIGIAGVISWKGISIEISDHAQVRIEERGLTVNQVESIMNKSNSFYYWDDGVLKQGWYDKGQKVLVAMAVEDQTLTTVMTGVDPQYIAGLRSKNP